MRPSRFGGFLLATGAIVGVAAVVGLMLGFEPSRLPPALLDIAAYKLTFGAAAVLLAAGAIVRRRGHRDELPATIRPVSLPADAKGPPARPLGVAEQDIARRDVSSARAEIPKQR